MSTENSSKEMSRCSPLRWGEVIDSTFVWDISLNDTKYIIKAVGKILLEIQNYISNEEIKPDNRDSVSPKRDNLHISTDEKRVLFKTNKNLSHEKLKSCVNDINGPTEQTYHRRLLDSAISKSKKPMHFQNGSLQWSDINSTNFSVQNNNILHVKRESEFNREDVDFNNFSDGENIYRVNRLNLSINHFVTSFYKSFPIISHSSFILSLIYIDRFIKSKCSSSLTNLSKFSITR